MLQIVKLRTGQAIMFAARASRTLKAKSTSALASHSRWASTTAEKDKYKFLIVGAGTYTKPPEMKSVCQSLFTGSGGLTVASQIRDRFRAAGKALNEDDIAVLDAADYHFYQVRCDDIYRPVTHPYIFYPIARMVSMNAILPQNVPLSRPLLQDIGWIWSSR